MRSQLHKVVKKRIKRAVENKSPDPPEASLMNKVCLACNRPVKHGATTMQEGRNPAPQSPHADTLDARFELELDTIKTNARLQDPDGKYVYRAGFKMPITDK